MVLFSFVCFPSNWLQRAYFIVTVHMLHRSSYGKGKTLKHYQLASNDAGNPRAFQTLFVTPGPSCRHNQTVNTDTEGTIQSVCINEMSVLTL